MAGVVDTEDGEAINVCVGPLTLAGIAAGDAICAAALGERYVGSDHAAAATLLGRVDRKLGVKLKSLIDLKPGAHYGNALLSRRQRDTDLRAARELVAAARERTTWLGDVRCPVKRMARSVRGGWPGGRLHR